MYANKWGALFYLNLFDSYDLNVASMLNSVKSPFRLEAIKTMVQSQMDGKRWSPEVVQ